MFLALLIVFSAVSVSNCQPYSFPRGKCYEKRCGASPYAFTWVSKTISDDLSKSTTCMRVHVRPCTVESQYGCCSTFRKQLKKFTMWVKPSCKDALVSVSVNGVEKGGGVFYDVYNDQNAELRVTSFDGIDENTASSTEICMTWRSPCIHTTDFCNLKNGLCYMSVWETDRHECCPRCTIGDAVEEFQSPPDEDVLVDVAVPDAPPDPMVSLSCQCKCESKN